MSPMIAKDSLKKKYLSPVLWNEETRE